MSDFLDQYNTGSERVTQQEIKPTSAPQDAGTPNEAPRRRRSDRYAQEEPALFDTPNEAPRQPMQPAYVQRAPEAAAPQTEGPWVRQQADASFSGDRSSWNEPNDVRPSVRMEEDEDEYEDDEEEGGGAPILRLFLIVLALVVALAAVLYFAPIQEDSFLYPAKALVDDGMKKVKALVNPVKDPAAQIVSFDCLQSSGTVGTRLMMTLVTTDAVQEVSLSTREEVDLKATVNALDNPVEGQKKWSVSKQFTEPFEGPVYAQVLVNGQWGTNNAKFVSLLVVQPTATPEPTQAPTKAPTQPPVLTPEPTAEPTAAPTAEPTEAPTAKPTAEPTDTSSLSALNQTEDRKSVV